MAIKYKNQSCQFHFIIPSAFLSDSEKRKYKRELKKTFTLFNEMVYIDADSLCEKYHATITPEVFLTGANDTIVYSGAIDDKYLDVLNHKQSTSQYYLKDAIEALLHHAKPKFERVEPVGCIITR